MPRMIFVNLPVTDLAASMKFYEALGFRNNPQFTDATAACMVWSEAINVMLLTHEKWGTFTTHHDLAGEPYVWRPLLEVSDLPTFVYEAKLRETKKNTFPGTVRMETPVLYFEKLGRMGGIVEEFIEAPEKASPSAQLRISPTGDVLPISTHDQILGGTSGQVFLGCVFPADQSYRMRMQEEAIKVGKVLASHGVVSRFGVDFLGCRYRLKYVEGIWPADNDQEMNFAPHPLPPFDEEYFEWIDLLESVG